MRNFSKNYQSGFTLIEVMIVVAIVGILSAIAMPSYNEYIRRGHRADARAGLLQAAQWLERASTAQGTYPTSLTPALTWKNSTDKRYTIDFVPNTSTTSSFTLQATRIGAQAADRCGNYTLTNTGVQGNLNLGLGATTSDCWRK